MPAAYPPTPRGTKGRQEPGSELWTRRFTSRSLSVIICEMGRCSLPSKLILQGCCGPHVRQCTRRALQAVSVCWGQAWDPCLQGPGAAASQAETLPQTHLTSWLRFLPKLLMGWLPMGARRSRPPGHVSPHTGAPAGTGPRMTRSRHTGRTVPSDNVQQRRGTWGGLRLPGASGQQPGQEEGREAAALLGCTRHLPGQQGKPRSELVCQPVRDRSALSRTGSNEQTLKHAQHECRGSRTWVLFTQNPRVQHGRVPCSGENSC